MRYDMKVLIFGTGKYYNIYRERFLQKDIEIIAFLDNDVQKQGGMVDGSEILSPIDGVKKEFDRIYLLSIYFFEMKKQLMELGIDEKKIYNIYDLYSLGIRLNCDGYCEKACTREIERNKRILLISFDMSLTGAQIALLYVSKILRDSGYSVIVASPVDGPLRKSFMSEEIPVMIDANLNIARLADITWMQNFDLIFINTVRLYYLLLRRNKDLPIIWWLHESEQLYCGVDFNELKMITQNNDNIYIYTVGRVAQEAFEKHCPDVNVQSLLYGIVDTYNKQKNSYNIGIKKCIFAVIGVLGKRKGQDILLNAISHLDKSYLEKSEFWIIGNDKGDFGLKIRASIKNSSNIKMFGELERAEIEKIYTNITILVCPSIEDTMPIVVTEAMMNYKVCIISSVIGNAQFILDKKNGVLCKNNDPEDLADKLKWAIDHSDEWIEIGGNAREVYNKYFSMKIFEKNLLNILDKILSE